MLNDVGDAVREKATGQAPVLFAQNPRKPKLPPQPSFPVSKNTHGAVDFLEAQISASVAMYI